jgi:phasin
MVRRACNSAFLRYEEPLMPNSNDSQQPPFEVPPAMRDVAEQTIEQSRHAYNQLIDASRRAQDMVTRSTDVMASSAREINERAIRYMSQNAEAGFGLARELARATDFKQVLELQQSFAQRQMVTYTQQAQELTRLMAEAAQRAQPKS